MSQTPIGKFENKLGFSTNLALENYSRTNLPPISSKKEIAENKLIKSEFNAEIRPKDYKPQTNVLVPPLNLGLTNVQSSQYVNPIGNTQYSNPHITNPMLTNTIPNPNLNPNPVLQSNVQLIPPKRPSGPYDPNAGYDRNRGYNPGHEQQSRAKQAPKKGFFSFGASKNNIPPALPPPPLQTTILMQEPRDFHPGDYKFYSTVKQAIPQNYPKTGYEKLMSCSSLTMRPIFNIDAEYSSCTKNVNNFYIYPGLHSREQYSIEPMFVVRESTNNCAKFFLTYIIF